jgi:hypothetical protein
MKSKKQAPHDFMQDGRDLASAAWEIHGPASGEFLVEKHDFSRLPVDALADLEEDRDLPFTEEEKKALEAGYRERMAELLEELIEGATEILEKVKPGFGL